MKNTKRCLNGVRIDIECEECCNEVFVVPATHYTMHAPNNVSHYDHTIFFAMPKKLLTTLRLLAFFSVAVIWPCRASAGEIITLKENGGWCWYQGPRAIVTASERLIFTTIAGDAHGDADPGDLWATSWDLNSMSLEQFELHNRFHRDDHDVAALLELPEGKILAVYGKHGNDHLQRWRISERPADISAWSEEKVFDSGAAYTYSNLFRLNGEGGRIYNFSRTRGYNPNCSVSDDGGITWRYGWRLLTWDRRSLADDPRSTGVDGGRPYLRYASDGDETIHFITTHDHPRAYDNSIFHGFYRQGKLHASDGKVIADISEAPSPVAFTELFAGAADRVAWTVDLELDAAGNPYAAFSVQVDGAAGRGKRDPRFGQDHRYYYARWDGDAWQVHEMAHAGTCLYTKESDYTGLVALDPQDPNFAVISTNADPVTGAPLVSKSDGKRHWELYRGRTTDGGKTWDWKAITQNSEEDNLRPIIPDWPAPKRVVLWARGTLRTFTDYHLDIVGLVEERATE